VNYFRQKLIALLVLIVNNKRNNMTEGYIYCFSNPSMPGLLKIGMTERTPEIRLKEANVRNTFMPTPFKIEFAKKVYNPSNKEKTLHILLEKYTERIPSKEFFRTSTEEVLCFFNLIDGEMWVENSKLEDTDNNSDSNDSNDSNDNDDNDDNDDYDDYAPDTISGQVKTSLKGEMCRDMKRCFTDGQRIRHTIVKEGINNTWEGTYNSSINRIVYNGEALSLNQFTTYHYATERPDRTPKNNAWAECYCEVNGEWIRIYNFALFAPL
jgi:hypothetical protein